MPRSTRYKQSESGWEEEEQPRRTYTTVKRYQVPEAVRSSFGDEDETTKEKIIIKRSGNSSRVKVDTDDIDVRITERTGGRDQGSSSREEDDYRFTERRTTKPRSNVSYRVVERDRESDYSDRRSNARGNYETDYRSSYRVERDREAVAAPSPPQNDSETVFRFQRERDFSPPRRTTRVVERDEEDDYEVERYSKTTNYYQQAAPAPQPIIIRERSRDPQPIIIREEVRRRPQTIVIREERREPQYEYIERQEETQAEEEEKSLVKVEEPTLAAAVVAKSTVSSKQQPDPPEEDYYYERRVREIDRAPRSEIRPRDSASNVSSGDSYEYVRRERTYSESDSGGSDHHKRHLAEGALVGVAGAEILRHHRRSQGRDPGGRLGGDLGGAAVGALGAEVVTRVRSMSRRRKDSRSRSRDFYAGGGGREGRSHRRRSRSDSRSRSKSVSRKTLLGMAGIAAVGALAGYAITKRNNNEPIMPQQMQQRRSRSRRRRSSSGSYSSNDKHQNPDHRNRRIAQAGLASAAAAGIWDKVRSKSRGGRDRSKSRLRQGIPIVATGLGGAALAGLYEKNKASKEENRGGNFEGSSNGRGRRRRSRSRGGRSRSRGVEEGSMYSGRDRGYYSDEEPGQYRRRHGHGSGSSPDTRRRYSRSRSRDQHLVETGAVAGAAAMAGREMGRRDERRKNSRSRSRRRRDEDDRYRDAPYGQEQYGEPPSGYLPDQQHTGYPGDPNYPQTNYFPPPPNAENAYASNPYPDSNYGQHETFPSPQQQQAPYQAYNPGDYAQGGPQYQPYQQSRGMYGESDANPGSPYGHDTHAYPEDKRQRTPRPQSPGDRHRRERGEDPENVSAPNLAHDDNDSEHENARDAGTSVLLTPPHTQSNEIPNEERNSIANTSVMESDGLRTPRARSTSRVRFNLGANTALSPDKPRDQDNRHSDTENSADRKQRRRHRRRHRHDDDDDGEQRSSSNRDSTGLMHDPYDRDRSSRHESDRDSRVSDATVDMPERFDEQGNRREQGAGEDLQDLLGGLASKFLGGGGGGGAGRGRRSGR